MKTILIINSSLQPTGGNSGALTDAYAQAAATNPAVRVITRNLTQTGPGHLSAEEMVAWMTPAHERNTEQAELAAISDTLVEEVKQADEIVLGVPMYNFGVPSVLKAWIDRIARAGVTFKYTETGPVGLLADKTVTVLAARGGQYASTPMDTQTDYLTHFFAFIGLTDIRFIYAEGLAMGEENATAQMAAAKQKINELLPQAVD